CIVRVFFFVFFVFFFSSRRRHTRFSRDWSSDVCSSDLSACGSTGPAAHRCSVPTVGRSPEPTTIRPPPRTPDATSCTCTFRQERSEERRVGKECRYRGTP